MSRHLFRSVVILLFSSLVNHTVTAQVTSGSLTVRVTRGGAPVSGATVCVGTSTDLNLYFQGITDGLGAASANGVPPSPFVVTANAQGDGARLTFSPVNNLSFFIAQVALPVSTVTKGGTVSVVPDPNCPTTAAGPSRSLIPSNIQFQPTPITWTGPTTLARSEFCFGALGAGCGEPQTGIPATALCGNGTCAINGGSWAHDECCFAFPNGMACRRGPLDAVTGNDGHCVTEWNKAVRLVGKNILWRRAVDFTRANTTGRVEFARYCAPTNSLVSPEDGNRCCSGITRALTAAETVVATVAFEALRGCQ